MNTLLAVQKAGMDTIRTLFGSEGSDSSVLKAKIETHLWGAYEILTVCQRCPMWFALRQFRVTMTNAGTVLLESSAFKTKIGLEITDARNEMTCREWFEVLFKRWFRPNVSTEAMMRGNANEGAVLSALTSLPFIVTLFECGMLAMKHSGYLACSPDVIATVDAQILQKFNTEEGHLVNDNGIPFLLATVEIKKRVASKSLNTALELATGDAVFFEVGDETFRKYIPESHTAQALNQMMILDVNVAIYLAAGETGLLYVVYVHCSGVHLATCQSILTAQTSELVQWAYIEGGTVPEFINDEYKECVLSGHHFWNLIDDCVKLRGPLPPLKLFKHASQSFYSKTKAGVDGVTQQKANLRSSTSHFQWEQ